MNKLKISEKLYFNLPLKYIYALSIIIASFFFFFYFNYLISAWFFQDDITFLFQYKDSLNFSEIFNFNNFGRFISRNVYWHFLYNIIGANAAFYFSVNLLLLVLNSVLLYLFIQNFLKDKGLAVISVLIYFIMPGSIKNIIWISNSQHLLFHLFLFLFYYFYFKENLAANLNYKNAILLFLIFLAAVCSNVLSIFVIPSIISFHFFYRKEIKLDRIKILLISGCSIIATIFALKLKKLSTGIYAVDYSLNTFLKTLEFYLDHLFGNTIVSLLVLFFIIFIGVIKKDKIILFLISTAIFFYVPVSFAVYQKWVNYIAIPYIFIIISILYIIIKYKQTPIIIFLLLFYVLFNSCTAMNKYSDNPFGERVETFITTMKYLQKGELKGYNSVCFKSAEKYINPTELVLFDIPPFWGRLYFGKALELFLNPTVKYVLYDEQLCENCPVIVVSLDLYLIKDSVIKKVIMPVE